MRWEVFRIRYMTRQILIYVAEHKFRDLRRIAEQIGPSYGATVSLELAEGSGSRRLTCGVLVATTRVTRLSEKRQRGPMWFQNEAYASDLRVRLRWWSAAGRIAGL